MYIYSTGFLELGYINDVEGDALWGDENNS